MSAAWLALAPLLLGTFIGTLNNNVVNVPMKSILGDLHVQLGAGALVVIAFNLTFAVLMPLTGWAGDRLGRRRVFCVAVTTVGAGAVGAALSPNLPVLVAFRVVQGAGTAAILPVVMALIAEIFGPVRRGRALGWWAAVNGLGQAVGPPAGGFLAGAFGWRSIFWPVVPLAAVAVVGALRLVPADRGRAVHLEWRGALSLTAGAALLLSSATAVPTLGWRSPAVAVLLLAGLSLLVVFRRVASRAATPFIPVSLLREPSYLRSCLAVTGQMFCLGATLLGVPLYLTRSQGISVARAGLLVFALPVAMTVLAPLSGLLTERIGPRRTIRSGLALLVLAEALVAFELASGRGRGADLVGTLVLAGVGVAFVQTPAATGATRSPAGRLGAGLGLFNLMRFAGSALGAAWVAIVLSAGGAYGLLFAACAAVGLLALAGTYAGPDPLPAGAAAPTEPARAVASGG